jgi:hypothetical protein
MSDITLRSAMTSWPVLRQALEAGADPVLVAVWTVDVQARKAEAFARQS